MNTDLKLLINSSSSSSTEQIGEQIGRQLRGGEVIVLESDLGGGKTTITRGIVSGTDSKDLVSSPTFTISNIYEAPKLNIYHFDFYRLSEPGLIKHELAEATEDDTNVIVLEWANIVEDILPKNILKININHQDGDNRKLVISYPKELTYLVKGIN